MQMHVRLRQNSGQVPVLCVFKRWIEARTGTEWHSGRVAQRGNMAGKQRFMGTFHVGYQSNYALLRHNPLVTVKHVQL